MMEEVGDDTNGESTFEFVGGKSDENILKEETSVSEAIEKLDLSTVQTTNFVPCAVPLQPPSVTTEQPNVTFYDPSTTPSFFTPPPVNPLMQSSPPPVNPLMPSSPPNTFAESPQSWNPYYSNAAPASVMDPGASAHYSVPMPSGDVAPNPVLPEISDGGSSVWGWIKGNQLLNKVAEKAKSSVDSVITTLDPGMKEIINTGGDISVIVASGNESKVSAAREAFQLVFGKATVQGISVQSSSIAPQPVGFSAGLKAAEERISNLRQQGYLDDSHAVLAIENFITELTPDNWFDIGCLLLQDSNSGISIQVYTEAVPISSVYVSQAKEQTPADYQMGWSGHAITIGQIIGSAIGVHHSEWHQALTGVSRREILFLAAKTIAGLYRSQLRR